MSSKRSMSIILAGYKDDIEEVRKALGVGPTVIPVPEDAEGDQIPKKADVVLYLMSSDTAYSSQLYSIFTYIHDHVTVSSEYLVALRNVDIRTAVFPTLSSIPEISVAIAKQRFG